MKLLFVFFSLISLSANAVIGFGLRFEPIVTFLDEEKELSKLNPGWLNESLINWNIKVDSLSNPNLSYGECANIKELQRVVLCVFPFRSDLNKAFSRIAIYNEGGSQIARGSILQHSDGDLLYSQKKIVGHNIPADSMLRFFKESSEMDEGYSPSPIEIELRETLVDSGVLEKNDYVIALSLETMGDPTDIASHEICHARLGVDPTYKQAIYAYWDSLTAEDKELVISTLGKKYNKNHLDVIIDEWQAHTLQLKPHKFFLKYRDQLINFLKQKGLSPTLM